MWTISAILLALAGAGSAAGGHLWGLWLLIAGGLCGARAERNLRDQEIALALFLWAMFLLLAFAAIAHTWDWLKGFWSG